MGYLLLKESFEKLREECMDIQQKSLKQLFGELE